MKMQTPPDSSGLYSLVIDIDHGNEQRLFLNGQCATGSLMIDDMRLAALLVSGDIDAEGMEAVAEPEQACFVVGKTK